MIAESAKDYCGAIFFNDDIVKIIPPAQGRMHTHRMMEEFFSVKPHGKTNFTKAFNKLLSLQKKDTMVFVLSDFLEQGSYETALRIAAKHHDVIAVQCIDLQEEHLTFNGQLLFEDPELGTQLTIDGTDNLYKELCHKKMENIHTLLNASGVDILKIETGQDFVGNIIRFFRKRMRA